MIDPSRRERAAAQTLIMAARATAYATERERKQRRPEIDAVERHDMMSPEAFDAIYEFIEPEIPFSSLTPPG